MTNKKITIYTTKICPYCIKAKTLFQKKGLSFEEIDALDDKIREEMIKKAGGRRTVPQIFIGDFHVGGYDDLHKMELDGSLDLLIKSDR